MAFSPVPNESRNQVNKAGHILIQSAPSSNDLQSARLLVERWRACHAYPINTFQANLRKKLKEFRHAPICAQRLKRMPTIIDKLKRYPAMKLTTMQDIGGVRAILESVSDVDSLTSKFRESDRLAHELVDEKDYIANPRSEDGYRSHHLVYKYNNKRAPSYDGLRLELQIRTKLEHIWATAVETMGTFLGQALKSRQGDQEWIDFFAVVSSAFAHKERCVPVPRFKNLSQEETFQAVTKAEEALQALDKMRGVSVLAAKPELSPRQGWSYHLIILNSLNHTVGIKSFNRENFEAAVEQYGKIEAQAVAGENIEPVLVSAGSFDNLRRAYPNFFLDINDFVENVKAIIKAPKNGRR